VIDTQIRTHLSAEPLVGLKRADGMVSSKALATFSRTPRGFEARAVIATAVMTTPFSRTPRGFEATLRVNTVVPTPLSAEPLVGLKPPESNQWRKTGSFSRTPRGFEAVSQFASNLVVPPFQPNPSWV